MKYRILIDMVYDDEGIKHIVYGIQAVEYDGKVILSISDISFDFQKVQAFVDKCNSVDLSLFHLHDVVEDFLTEQYLV